MRWIIPLLLLTLPASAHDHWPDGNKVADDIKAQCCGEAEHVEIIDPRLVHNLGGGQWAADGYTGTAAEPDHVKPSIDEHTWIFYSVPVTWEKGKLVSPEHATHYLHCLLIQLSM